MIMYFSGTGNSAYVAEKTAHLIDDSVENLFQKIRDNDDSPMHSESPYVFVAPTYAWQIPRIVSEWIEKTDFSGNKSAYFVMTCGSGIGNAGKFLAELCEKKGFRYMGCAEIVMPENYIAMFKVPEEKKALAIIEKAQPAIYAAAECIKNRTAIPPKKLSAVDKLSSKAVNKLFYPLFVHSKKFYATDECIGCGKCTAVCPLNNVKLNDGKPLWHDHCTHCMACICRCPKNAIEYGNKSKGQPRYICPAKSDF